MAINLVADTDNVHSLGSPPGSGGYVLREAVESSEPGRIWEAADQPGDALWLVAREWIAANGEQSEEAWAADLDAAKARRKEEVNREARYLLAESDWYRLREADGGAAMPAAVLTYRTDVRSEANAAAVAIDAITDDDVHACRDFVPSWPTAP